MPATEKMNTENTESSFPVFSVCILQWPALSVVASNFGIEVYAGWTFLSRLDSRTGEAVTAAPGCSQ